MLRATLSLNVLVLLLVAPAAQAATWLRPVDGPLLREFAPGGDPYARGWHRGVDLAAARGSPVRSACAGRVTFAGRVPRGGPTVSVRCGALVATYQQLGTLAVRAGADVRRGGRLGDVGASNDPRQGRSHLHLGARVLATGRYVDPLRMLGPGPSVPLAPPGIDRRPRGLPPGPAPAARRVPRAAPARPSPIVPRAGRAAAVVRRVAPPAPLSARPLHAPPAPLPARRAHAPPARDPPIPWLVWVGLAAFGLGLPLGGLVRVRRRGRAASAVVRAA